MKEDNGRDKLLCFLLLDTIPSICPKIASGNARNHPPERFPSRQLLQLRGYFPSRPPPPPPPSVFSANLSLPSSHESVSGPRLLFLALSRRALTRETRRGWPSPLLPSSLWIYTRPSRHGQQWEFRKPCRRREFKLARTTMTVVRGRGINDILL